MNTVGEMIRDCAQDPTRPLDMRTVRVRARRKRKVRQVMGATSVVGGASLLSLAAAAIFSILPTESLEVNDGGLHPQLQPGEPMAPDKSGFVIPERAGTHGESMLRCLQANGFEGEVDPPDGVLIGDYPPEEHDRLERVAEVCEQAYRDSDDARNLREPDPEPRYERDYSGMVTPSSRGSWAQSFAACLNANGLEAHALVAAAYRSSLVIRGDLEAVGNQEFQEIKKTADLCAAYYWPIGDWMEMPAPDPEPAEDLSAVQRRDVGQILIPEYAGTWAHANAACLRANGFSAWAPSHDEVRVGPYRPDDHNLLRRIADLCASSYPGKVDFEEQAA